MTNFEEIGRFFANRFILFGHFLNSFRTSVLRWRTIRLERKLEGERKRQEIFVGNSEYFVINCARTFRENGNAIETGNKWMNRVHIFACSQYKRTVGTFDNRGWKVDLAQYDNRQRKRILDLKRRAQAERCVKVLQSFAIQEFCLNSDKYC